MALFIATPLKASMPHSFKKKHRTSLLYKSLTRLCLLFPLLMALSTVAVSSTTKQEQKIALGKLLFNDTSLSSPEGQSCSSCHRPGVFHSDEGKIASLGANPQHFGNRNAPSLSYSKFTPKLYWDKKEEHWVGGFFLDGRALTLEEQASGPLLNPLEMGNTTKSEVIAKLKKANYISLFEEIYGNTIWSSEDAAFAALTDAIAAYETGPEFGLFSSKYDLALIGKAKLTPLELEGLQLFEAKEKGNCAACHISQFGENDEPPLFTDFTYDNLGLPAFPQMPFLAMAKAFNPEGSNYKDIGLASNAHTKKHPEGKHHDQTGKFKVPTLRNIAKTAPYMHNGMFETLEEVVEFYNERDVSERWGEPEIRINMNTEELGNLKLTKDEIKAIVAFMQTLTDGYRPHK